MSCSVKSSVSPRSRGDPLDAAGSSRASRSPTCRRSARPAAAARARWPARSPARAASGRRGTESRSSRRRARAGRARPAAPPSPRDRGARPGSTDCRPRPRWDRKAACTFSCTVSFGKMLVRWNERPIPSRQMSWGARPVTSRPSRSTVPESGLQVSGDQVEEGRLAGAVGPDDGGDPAPVDLHADPAHGQEAVEALADVADLKHAGHSPAGARPPAPLPPARRGTRTAARPGSRRARTASTRCRT